MVTLSKHLKKSAARKEATKWKNKGYKVFIEHPYYGNIRADDVYTVSTEGRGSKAKKGHIVDVTKTQK